jgi:hypothetical protein
MLVVVLPGLVVFSFHYPAILLASATAGFAATGPPAPVKLGVAIYNLKAFSCAVGELQTSAVVAVNAKEIPTFTKTPIRAIMPERIC